MSLTTLLVQLHIYATGTKLYDKMWLCKPFS